MCITLLHCPADADRNRGAKVLTEIEDILVHQGHSPAGLPVVVGTYLAWERVRLRYSDDLVQVYPHCHRSVGPRGLPYLAGAFPRQVCWWRPCSIVSWCR